MRNIVSILFFSGIFMAFNAYGQNSNFPAECYKRCTGISFEDTELVKDEIRAKLNKIRATKKAETDPVKIKELDEDEKMEIEKIEERLEKSCRKNCKYQG
jgi:hypothetical protein